MRGRPVIRCFLAGALWALPAAGLSAGGSFAAGFYTRGIEAATYMDQGAAVADPFYVPAKAGTILPRVSLAVAHEDNVFLDPDEPKSGTSVSLAPGLLALWGRPTDNHLYADYGLVIPIYESAREMSDRPSHLLRLGGLYQTGKSQIRGELGYRALEDVDAAVGARIAQQDLFADVNLEHRISGKSSAGALGRFERHLFDSDRYREYDRLYGAGRYYRRASAKSEVFVQAGLGRDEPLEPIHASGAADFHDVSLGLRGKHSPKFNSSGRFGYMWRTYDEEAREDFAHWIAAWKAESNPFGLSTFSLELYADVRPAIDAEGVDVVDQGVVGSVSRRLFVERLRGNASVTLGRIDYSGGGAAGGGADEDESLVRDGRRDDYWGFSLGVDWWTRQHMSLGLAYSYMERNGSRNGDEAAQDATSYEQGRWTFRASWNY